MMKSCTLLTGSPDFREHKDMAETSVQASANLADGLLPGDGLLASRPSEVDMLCAAFGMNPRPENELERPDIDFLQVLNPKFPTSPGSANHN
jgi:hypothetical protein